MGEPRTKGLVSESALLLLLSGLGEGMVQVQAKERPRAYSV